MNLRWESLSAPIRTRLVWVLWCVTWLLLLAGLYERIFYEFTVWFSVAHALLFMVLFAFGLTAFPVQVRVAYIAWVAVGTYVPGMTILLYITMVGLFTNLFFDYCPLARIVSLLPWNRDEQMSANLLKRTFFSPPTRGRFIPPSTR